MAKNPDTNATIEELLEQRAQYEQWLTKLDGAANKAPTSVRNKVRGDYEARLRGVIEQLRGHSATIAGELERHQSEQADLDAQRQEAEDELAEAEVRHAVGEFTDEEWERIRGESDGRLGGLREQLNRVGSEIARLAEVQQLIGGARPKPAEPPAPPAPAPSPEPPQAEVIERSPPPPPPPPPADPDPVEEEAPRSAAQPVDELAFLKSVADDEELKPASRRVSSPGAGAPAQTQRTVETPPAAAPAGKGGAPGVAKTLKCGECGTLNRPTEWYCERCGAELAGV